MKKLNNKGFGIAGILIVVVIVGLIGLVGYRVLSSSSNRMATNNMVDQTELQAEEDSNNQKNNNSTEIFTSSGDSIKFGTRTEASIKVPKDWQVQTFKPTGEVSSSTISAYGKWKGEYNNVTSIAPTLSAQENISLGDDIEFDAESAFSEGQLFTDKSLIINKQETNIAGLPAKVVEFRKINSSFSEKQNKQVYDYVLFAVIYKKGIIFKITMSGDANDPNLPLIFKESLNSFTL